MDVVNNPQYFVPPGAPAADDLFNGGVYVRGGLTLHALRLEVGDEAFFEILKTYFARYRNGNVTTGEFIAVAREVSGKELADLFEAWLYDETIPPIPAMGLGDE
jgi:aminopeptidase N